MKKNLLSNTSIKVITGLLLITMIGGCKKNNQPALSEIKNDNSETASSSIKRPGTTSDVFLKLTVNNATGDRLTSDGGGDYVNGSQGVSARFDQYGNFIFGIGAVGHGQSASLVRWLNIDFSSPVVVYSNPPITGHDIVTAITTIPGAAFPNYTFLQNLTVGQTECITLTGGSNANWVMNFHRATEDVSTSQSAYMVVTRMSATQWTMIPVGSCSPNSNVCALRNGPDILYGYWNMPFSFTLTSL